MTKKTDPRVIRTRQMLRDALIATVLEKGYDAVSIQDITDQAGLRRATFYLHYRDKEELLLNMLRETLDELMQRMETSSHDFLTEETELSEEATIFHHVQERANLYRAILSGQGATVITRGLRDYLAARIRDKCLTAHPETDLPVPVDALANYLAAVKLNMIIWWLENGTGYTPEQMAEICARLVLHGTSELLTAHE